MLDLAGALFFGAYLATLAAILVWPSCRSIAQRVVVTLALVGWLGAVLAATHAGAFAPGTLGPLPPGLVPFTVLLVAIFVAWARSRRVRDALLRLDRARLVGLHGFRLGGMFFILLGLAHRLAPSFAWIAGIGDVLVGAGALALSARLATEAPVSDRAIRTWNALGAFDLVVAVAVAVLSVRAHATSGEPGMETMVTMPWIVVPAAIVPLLLLTHVVIAAATAEFAARGRT
jgi:hypothetical protein